MNYVMIWKYTLSTLFGSLLFVLIFLVQMILILDISPPLKLFLAPSIVGGAAGFLIGHWKARSKALYDALLQHQKQLEETITLKTQELERKNKDLKMLSATDSLTGLGNRRLFDIAIKNEWSRLTRVTSPLSLIMCDIDYFKQYNDTYGHQQGDNCLKAVADILKKHANRIGDLAARYGGEEFCIILPNTEYTNTLKIADSLRESIELLNIVLLV